MWKYWIEMEHEEKERGRDSGRFIRLAKTALKISTCCAAISDHSLRIHGKISGNRGIMVRSLMDLA
jgi:hypothetical protein